MQRNMAEDITEMFGFTYGAAALGTTHPTTQGQQYHQIGAGPC